MMVQSDNRTVVAYLRNQGGTRSSVLLESTRELLLLAHRLRVDLLPFYIPGRINTIADALSRGRNVPDSHLSTDITTMIFQRMGSPLIDLFATDRSKVVPLNATIDAKDPQALFVNAFSKEWHYQLAWIFPPPPLIPKVLQHLNKASGSFLIIVPRWENAFWRGDLKRRSVAAPCQIRNLDRHLIDLSTNQPTPGMTGLVLEVWKVRGGTT